MKKLEDLKEELKEQCSRAQNPILCFSGGKDSLLLLYCLNENVPILIFDAFWSKAQKKKVFEIIEERDLTAFSYKPEMVDCFAHDEGMSAVAFYKFGTKTIPVVADVIYTETCGLELSGKAMSGKSLLGYLWDLTVTGSKKCDFHPLVKKLDLKHLSDERHEVLTPLWDWTDEEVLEGLNVLGVNYNAPDELHDTGNFTACLNCQRKDAVKVFCPKQNKEIELCLI